MRTHEWTPNERETEMNETLRQAPRVSSPVETLTEELYARFAETIGLDQDALTAELEGELTSTTLRRLAAATGISKEFWAGLNRAWVNQKGITS